jgi:hypothetical protein
MICVEAITQTRHTGSNLVELDTLLAAIYGLFSGCKDRENISEEHTSLLDIHCGV